jgi:solute carrier family 25 iron transporter 28/37
MEDAEHEQEYEALPESSTMGTHMLAGAAAGIMEHCIMYPVDCVKTRMQVLVPDPRANYRNVYDALTRIVRHEGMRNTVRGISAVVGGAGPAHALYFATYEQLKKQLSNKPGGNGTPLTQGIAGAGATLLHDAVMNPVDVIKQRMQVFGSPYKTCMECGRTVIFSEGYRAFYRSYTTQLTMNIPFQSIHFIMYEFCQDRLNVDRTYKPSTHILSGAVAGGIAAAITTPLDVCKTLLNTQERCAINKQEQGSIQGLRHAIKTVHEFQGKRGFFNGLSARVIYQMPSTAISWSVYEFIKYFITKRSNTADCQSSSFKRNSCVNGVQVHALED